MTTTSWTAALDEFEARLTRAEAQLSAADDAESADANTPDEARAYEVPAFEPPDLTGALPARLTARARQLLTRADDLIERFGAEQRRIREELTRTPRIPPGRHAGSTLDVHA